jgi:serine/threonine-protein kinase
LYRGDTVTITVSLGPELIEVPNVVGKSMSEATRILEEAGFEVNVEMILGGYFATVRAQDPGAGEQVRRGTTITLTVV